MGNYFSSNFNMSDIENDSDHLEAVSDSDDDLFSNIEQNDLSEHYLVIIFRHLCHNQCQPLLFFTNR